MSKKTGEKIPLTQDFAFGSDAELNAKISAFQAVHANATGERLAMDARRPLGAGKARVTFRVVEERGGKRR